MLIEIESAVRDHAAGKDPISIAEALTTKLGDQVLAINAKFVALQNSLDTAYVPISTRDSLLEQIAAIKGQLADMSDELSSARVKKDFAEKELARMQILYINKDADHKRLTAEYTELSEAVSSRYGKSTAT